MSQDSATITTPTTPPTSSTADDLVPISSLTKPSSSSPTQQQLEFRDEEEDTYQVTLEPERAHSAIFELIQPPWESPESNLQLPSESNPPLPLTLEPNQSAEVLQVTPETSKPEESKAAVNSEQIHLVTPETVTSQPEESENAFEDSELTHLVTPETMNLEADESNYTAEDSEQTQRVKPETMNLEAEESNYAAKDLKQTHLATPDTMTLNVKVFNHAVEDSDQEHRMTPDTMTLEADESNHAAEDPEQTHCVKPDMVTSESDPSLPEESKNTAEDDSEKPHGETELTQKLMMEQRKKYTEVADWTEPVPPDAAVLEAAASENQDPPAPSSSVESRSLAEMMNREESEDKPKIQIPRSLGSFKEETNKISDLSESEVNALHELKHLLQESDSSKSFIWGVPLLKDDRSDIVLLKFLRARDFKPQDAYSMLHKTLQWRVEFNIEELLDENLGDDLDKVVFMQGHDRDNHPVCYNVYGEFQNKYLYRKTFSDEQKRERFLRWRIQFLEKSIRNLDFVAGGVSTICQVNDLKNSPGPAKTELRLATKQALHLLQDNYPEFVSKQIFINVPWWYLAFYKIISPFMTQRSKSKLVFSGSSRSAETLFKYISPEQVPVQYGGLSVDNCDCNSDFTHDDIATEITIKPSTKQTVEIIIYEKCTIVWEIRVVGWEVMYGAEYVPENKEGYTVIIQKPRKMAAKDEPVVSQSFKVGEVGKILLTVDNPTSTKKMLIYRFKVKPFAL